MSRSSSPSFARHRARSPRATRRCPRPSRARGSAGRACRAAARAPARRRRASSPAGPTRSACRSRSDPRARPCGRAVAPELACARGYARRRTERRGVHLAALTGPEIELSYCVVNTSQRELLLRGLDAIARERASAAVRHRGAGARQRLERRLRSRRRAHTPRSTSTIALPERRGKALNDSELLRRARGRYALLLNEDSELLPGRDARAVAGAAGPPASGVRGRQAAASRRSARRPALGAFRRPSRRSPAR